MPSKKAPSKAKLHHTSGEPHLQRCTFVIERAGDLFGEIIVELCSYDCPKTCELFLQNISSSEKNRGKQSTYKNCPIKRLTKIGLQSGETFPPAKSVNASELDSEVGRVSHALGTLSICRYSNSFDGSQFFFCLTEDPVEIEHLNKRHAVFGKIVSGIAVLQNLVEGLDPYIEEDGEINKSSPFLICEVVPTANETFV